MTKRKLFTVLTLILLILPSCSRDNKNDVRNVKWGMTKEQVKVLEAADLVKEGDSILTYRLGGNSIPLNIESKNTGDGETTGPQVEMISYEYDLLYVFGDDGLGMVVIHLREHLDKFEHYMDLFKEQTRILSKKIGKPPTGVASYEDKEVKSNPYEDPLAICKGEQGLQHIWLKDDERTKVYLEMDQKKFTPDTDCNISIFYESTDIPVNQQLTDELHDLL